MYVVYAERRGNAVRDLSREVNARHGEEAQRYKETTIHRLWLSQVVSQNGTDNMNLAPAQ